MKRLLPCLLMLLSSAALAEAGDYQVEIIVFRHLDSGAEGVEVDGLRSYSGFPDAPLPGQGEGPAAAVDDERLPDDLRPLAARSQRMDATWDRLQSSGRYQPLLYAAWQQNRIDYYPPMRLHDQQVVATELRPPTHIMVAELAADDPLAAYRSRFYRLDGSLQLLRSRFLHLLVDLEYRDDQPAAPELAQFPAFEDPAAGENPGARAPGLVYSLRQRRQVRTGAMQYFDTPYLGALVLVSGND